MMYTITERSEGKYHIKGSKFLSFLIPVKNHEEIRAQLRLFRRRYSDATHVCYAYVLGDERFYSDAGEPKHSAGAAILKALQQHHLQQVLLIVVRYFGGTKLGLQGLKEAYFKAALNAIENNQSIIPFQPMKLIRLVVPYEQLDQFHQCLRQVQVQVKHWDYHYQGVVCEIVIPENLYKQFAQWKE